MRDRPNGTSTGPTLGELKTDDIILPETWKTNLRAIADAPLATLPLAAIPHRSAAAAMERAGLIEVWRNRRQAEHRWEERIRPGANGKVNGKGAKRIKVRVCRQRKLEPTVTMTTWAAWCLGLELDEVAYYQRRDAKAEAAEVGLEMIREEPVVEWGPAPDGMPEDGPKGLAEVAGTSDRISGEAECWAEDTPIAPHPGIPQTGTRRVTLTLGGGAVDVTVRG